MPATDRKPAIDTLNVVSTLAEPDRRLVLEAVHNFRDLGGYPTSDGW